MSVWSKLQNRMRFMRDARAWPFLLQRRVTDPERRRRVARWLARQRPRPLNHALLDKDRAATLAREGIVCFEALLSQEEVDQTLAWLVQRPVSDGYRRDVPPFLPLGEGRHPHSHVAFHKPDDVIAAPHLLALANRPELLAIAEDFLGCRATIGYLAAWWSYPTGMGPQQAENFHRDFDDWRFLKLFVYLTDVGDSNGPHIYVARSAERTEFSQIKRFDDDEVAAIFGMEQIMVKRGKAGSGFFENTFGLHKGKPLEKGRRLIFQVVYSLSPLPYGPRKPVAQIDLVQAREGRALEPFANRVYLDK